MFKVSSSQFNYLYGNQIHFPYSIARLIGYNQFDSNLPDPIKPGGLNPKQIIERKARNSFVASGLQEISQEFPSVIELVRGRGLMIGIKCKIKNTDFVEKARTNKLLTVKASDNVVRLLPPLILNSKECEEGLSKIRSTCEMF